MMRHQRQYAPVRINDYAGRPASVTQTIEGQQEVDLNLVAGILFWMTLAALAVISFAL